MVSSFRFWRKNPFAATTIAIVVASSTGCGDTSSDEDELTPCTNPYHCVDYYEDLRPSDVFVPILSSGERAGSHWEPDMEDI